MEIKDITISFSHGYSNKALRSVVVNRTGNIINGGLLKLMLNFSSLKFIIIYAF